MAIPVLGIALMIQTGIISRINLLSGSADLILAILVTWSIQDQVKTSWYWALIAGLMVGYISGLPWFIPLAGYLLVVAIGRLLHRRVWQAVLLETFIVIFIGTFGIQLLTVGYLAVMGGSFQIGDVISLIILPSTLLNLLLVIPVYYLIKDLALWLYPAEVNL
jgi:cell shape-determining protein MreD